MKNILFFCGTLFFSTLLFAAEDNLGEKYKKTASALFNKNIDFFKIDTLKNERDTVHALYLNGIKCTSSDLT